VAAGAVITAKHTAGYAGPKLGEPVRPVEVIEEMVGAPFGGCADSGDACQKDEGGCAYHGVPSHQCEPESLPGATIPRRASACHLDHGTLQSTGRGEPST